MKYIFLDTNIFLHFKDIEQIDWSESCDSDKYKLIIAPVVQDELDKHKRDNNKISKRARSVLNKFERIDEEENYQLCNNVFIEILTKKAPKYIYEQNELNIEEPDQRLIASMLYYKRDDPSMEIMLCSDDIGPRMRVKEFNIGVIRLDDKYRIPNDETDTEKKLKKLEQENLILKTKSPKLNLEFQNGKNFIRLSKGSINISVEDEQKREFMENKNKYPILEREKKENSNNNPLASMVMTAYNSEITDEQIFAYNIKLNDYFKKYQKYQLEVRKYKERINLSIELEIFLNNKGTVPAENIDIHLHFPGGFELIEYDKIPTMPNPPKPPYKPKYRFDFGAIEMDHDILLPKDFFGKNSQNSPKIRKTNSYDVDFHFECLKHTYKISLKKLVTIYSNIEEMVNYKIDYKVSDANMLKPVIGKLNVIFK